MIGTVVSSLPWSILICDLIFYIFDILQKVSLLISESCHTSFLSSHSKQEANGAINVTPAILLYFYDKWTVGPLPKEYPQRNILCNGIFRWFTVKEMTYSRSWYSLSSVGVPVVIPYPV